jgi:deazaflavin-dependent oxidoreductase (nitroreductase family)
MRRYLALMGVLGGTAVGAATWWRAHRRFGAAWVNRTVDQWVVDHGVIDKTRDEIGLIEHVGRRTGVVRVSPVHPVPTDEGFRIIVPLGLQSQWAQNVVAAGHCRLQVGETVYELDEPVLVAPSVVDGLPRPARRAMDWLEFRYLRLRRFAEKPGGLDEVPRLTDVALTEELVSA